MLPKWININVCHFLIHLIKITSFNTYPILPLAPPEVQEGPCIAEAPPQVSSAEWGLEEAYHLKVVQAKRRELVDKEVMFTKKCKKYNKTLNRLTWLNACSSGISTAT